MIISHKASFTQLLAALNCVMNQRLQQLYCMKRMLTERKHVMSVQIQLILTLLTAQMRGLSCDGINMTYKNREILLAENKAYKLLLKRLKTLIEDEQLFTDSPNSDQELCKIRQAIAELEI